MLNILVTGTSGFIGGRFLELCREKYLIKTISLRGDNLKAEDFLNIDCVLHLAAKVHQMTNLDNGEYATVNFELTKKLAQQAKLFKVSHFIFVSSVKVYGDQVEDILDEKSTCNPDDAYGKSKFDAEKYLQTTESEDFRITIIRPPMVYGPGGKGNMLKLIELAAKKIPLPFGNINNRRTIVFVDNLIAMINLIIDKKAGGIFIPADAKTVSTTELLSTIQKKLFNKSRLITIPTIVRTIIKKVKPALHSRLFGSSEFNNSLTSKLLGFIPPYPTEIGIEKTVDWYIKNKK